MRCTAPRNTAERNLLMNVAPGTPIALMNRIDTVSLPSAALEMLKPVSHADYRAYLGGLKLITGNGYLHRAREARKRFAELTHGKSVEKHLVEAGPMDDHAVTVAVKMFADDGGILRYIDEISTVLGGRFLVQTHGYATNIEGFTLDDPHGPASIELFMLTANDHSGSADAWLNFTGKPSEAQTISDTHNVLVHKALEHGALEAIRWLNEESSWSEFVNATSH